ncbi:MAG: GNAT family protein [Pseudomonadota bacterium]
MFLRADIEAPILVSGPITLRQPKFEDYPLWHAVKQRDRKWLQPMQPRWREDHLEKESYQRRVSLFARQARRGEGFVFHLFAAPDDRFVGFCQLAPVQYGASQSGTVGYWVAQPEWGQGFGTHAVTALAHLAFSSLGLARLEAHCLPHNLASARVLQKVGFLQEGHLRHFLEIDGERQDHLLYAKLAETT